MITASIVILLLWALHFFVKKKIDKVCSSLKEVGDEKEYHIPLSNKHFIIIRFEAVSNTQVKISFGLGSIDIKH